MAAAAGAHPPRRPAARNAGRGRRRAARCRTSTTASPRGSTHRTSSPPARRLGGSGRRLGEQVAVRLRPCNELSGSVEGAVGNPGGLRFETSPGELWTWPMVRRWRAMTSSINPSVVGSPYASAKTSRRMGGRAPRRSGARTAPPRRHERDGVLQGVRGHRSGGGQVQRSPSRGCQLDRSRRRRRSTGRSRCGRSAPADQTAELPTRARDWAGSP